VLEEVDLSTLPAHVRERWPAAVERAERKAASVAPDRSAHKLIKAAQQASNASQRIVWLHRAATSWAKPLEAVSACRKGCAHCCNIPVTISSIEAELIGRHVGTKPAKPARVVRLQDYEDLSEAVPALQDTSTRSEPSPCPFLDNSVCSIYEIRPMACRLLVNLDDDDLLCRHVPGHVIPVPYANSQALKGVYLLAQPTAALADVRDFFPRHASL
jgi:Fe-S-cluster containining protein